MGRILIHIPMSKYGEYDVFNRVEHNEFLQHVNEVRGGNCPNVGNRLWFQGLLSEIQANENSIEYYLPSMSKEYINDHFDLIIAPMANVFASIYSELLKSLAERFAGIRIPVYVIACGIQADSFDELDDLCEDLREAASAFISSIYETGGEFALRGYFTKEFFERLGFSSAVVTGCPSLYQMGRNLSISSNVVPEKEFRPLFNGTLENYCGLMKEYENAEFFDQHIYFHELWDEQYINDSNCLRKMINRYGIDTTQCLLQDRVKLIPDMNDWREYLISNGYSMSYGSRIHGSIMPILAGIPALLEIRDARTREMAEFFDIPCVEANRHRKEALYSLYQKVDYSKFNLRFAERFDAYEAFLKKCGIVKRVSDNNMFFHRLDHVPVTSMCSDKRKRMLGMLERCRPYWLMYERTAKIRHKMDRLIRSNAI